MLTIPKNKKIGEMTRIERLTMEKTMYLENVFGYIVERLSEEKREYSDKFLIKQYYKMWFECQKFLHSEEKFNFKFHWNLFLESCKIEANRKLLVRLIYLKSLKDWRYSNV